MWNKEQKALRAWRLSQRLNDGRKLVVALRYYDHHLTIGKFTKLGPPRREKSRRLHKERAWLAHLSAARRLGGIVFRNRIDARGKPFTEYYLGMDIWQSATGRLILNPVAGDASESLWVAEEQRRKEAREQFAQQTAFKCALLDPEIAWAFKSLPVGWQLKGEIQAFSDRLPELLERTKEYLLRNIDKETRTRFARSQNERAGGAARVKRAPQLEKPPLEAGGWRGEAFEQPLDPEYRRRPSEPITPEQAMSQQIKRFLVRLKN